MASVSSISAVVMAGHCRYAIEHGAVSCTGIDLSEKMLHQAQKRNGSLWTNYRCMAIEDYEFESGKFRQSSSAHWLSITSNPSTTSVKKSIAA